MTTTNWRKAATGDFAKKGKWDNGVPGVHTDAVIAATGANYVVKVISADTAHTLTLNSINATLLEKIHGSLDVGLLDIEHGTAILTTANTIDSITMTGGDLKFSNSAALGAAAISLGGKATLVATADAETFNNITLALNEASIAVRNGHVLKLDGSLSFNTSIVQTLDFFGTGANGGDGTGVVNVDGTVGAMSTHTILTITGVTLGSSIANGAGLSTLLSEAQAVNMENNNSVLDLTHQDNTTLHNFSGVGELLNSDQLENLSFVGGEYAGKIKGDFDITMAGGEFSATIALDQGDEIHVLGGAGFDNTHFQGDAPAIHLEQTGNEGGFLDLFGTTFGGAPPTVDLGTGQNVEFDISHTFTGEITNFGGHNGGTDHIFIEDEGGHGTPTLRYEPNDAGTGGELVVTYGTGPSFTLSFEGSYTQGDFTVASHNSTEIDCSAEQSAPHLVDALI